MKYITLDEAKSQLNIETGYTIDDQYITHLVDVAETACDNYTNGGLSGYTTNDVPATVKQAVLLFVTHLYTNRSTITFAKPETLPFGFTFLLDFEKDFVAN